MLLNPLPLATGEPSEKYALDYNHMAIAAYRIFEHNRCHAVSEVN
jgi:hypothetical protein